MDTKERGERKRTDKEEVKEDRTLAKQREHKWIPRNQRRSRPIFNVKNKMFQKRTYIFEAAHEVVAHGGAGKIGGVWTAAHVEEII